MSSTAVIHFVGLVVLMRQLTPEGNLEAVAPRVLAEHHVEEHSAIVAFRACDYVSSKGWAPQALEAIPGYLYVHVDGDQVQFSNAPGSGSTGTATKGETARLARQAPAKLEPVLLPDFGLPRLSESCKGGVLKREYQREGGFSKAAGVFSIPWANPKACIARGKGGRVDAVMNLANDGVVLLTSTRRGGRKELRVRGTAELYVANIPTAFVKSGAKGDGQAHFGVYFQMMEQTSSGCTWGPVLSSASLECPTPLRPPGSPNMEPQFFIDFQCSNSQFP